MTNKRIKQLNDNAELETLSDSIIVRWDPVNETANITFVSSNYLKLDGEYLSRVDGGNTVSITREDMLAEEFEVGGSTITGAMVDAYIRLLYDKLYNEQVP